VLANATAIGAVAIGIVVLAPTSVGGKQQCMADVRALLPSRYPRDGVRASG
jgi:hypothetical protein